MILAVNLPERIAVAAVVLGIPLTVLALLVGGWVAVILVGIALALVAATTLDRR